MRVEQPNRFRIGTHMSYKNAQLAVYKERVAEGCHKAPTSRPRTKTFTCSGTPAEDMTVCSNAGSASWLHDTLCLLSGYPRPYLRTRFILYKYTRRAWLDINTALSLLCAARR